MAFKMVNLHLLNKLLLSEFLEIHPFRTVVLNLWPAGHARPIDAFCVAHVHM
jgi:hypothetical protein